MSLSQEPADLSKQFPDLAEDFHIPQFFAPDQFFSSVFRISSCGLQLWTHYDVSVQVFFFFFFVCLSHLAFSDTRLDKLSLIPSFGVSVPSGDG